MPVVLWRSLNKELNQIARISFVSYNYTYKFAGWTSEPKGGGLSFRAVFVADSVA